MGRIGAAQESQRPHQPKRGVAGKPRKTKEKRGREKRQNGFSERNQIAEWTAYLLAVRGLSQSTVNRYRFLVVRALMGQGALTLQGIETHLKQLYWRGPEGQSGRES